jgi:hypothetical protein
MVCFTQSRYHFTVKNKNEWCKRIGYYYRSTVFASIATELDGGIAGASLTHSGIRADSLLERIPESNPNAIVTVDTGRIWSGSAQKKIFPRVPLEFRELKLQAKTAEKQAESEKTAASVLSAWQSIKSMYKSGCEMMIRRDFDHPLDADELKVQFQMLQASAKIKRAFYDPVQKTIYMRCAGRIISMSHTQIRMSSDVTFDLDDGFRGSPFQPDEFKHWSQWFDKWKADGCPKQVLPWLL